MAYDLEGAKNDIATLIWECGMILDKTKSPDGQGFKLVFEGKGAEALSPIYLDSRVLPSYPGKFYPIARHLFLMMTQLEADADYDFNCIADVPTGATPITTLVCMESYYPMISPREAKGHGTQGTVYGHFEPGMKVALFDDVVTTGGSLMRSGEILRQAGLEVKYAFCLIDREQGGRERLQEVGIELISAFKLRWLLEFYLKEGWIELGWFNEVDRYLGHVV